MSLAHRLGRSGSYPLVFGPDDLLPFGRKVRGLNLVPAESTWAMGATGDGWSVLWHFWDLAWLETLLDDAGAFGANVVRTMGSIRGIWLGYYDRATYYAEWDALSAACRARGLYLYPVMNPGGTEIAGIPYATVEAEAVAWAEHVTAYGNVIAIDVVQEDTDYGMSTDGVNLITALRAATHLPLTYSVTGTTKSQLGNSDNTTVLAGLAGIVDFYDLHWYYNPAASDIETYYWGTGHTKPLIIGEYGEPLSYGQVAQTARMEAVAAAINYVGGSGRRPAGALAWCARDFGTDPATSMGGLSAADGTRRTWIITPFETIPKI